MKYTVEIRDGQSVEEVTIEADTVDGAIKKANEATVEFLTDGDWEGKENGGSYSGQFSIYIDGEKYTEKVTAEIEPDEDALMRKAGLNPDCDHDWVSNGDVYAEGGTATFTKSHCRHCGAQKIWRYTGDQRNPGEHDTVKFLPGPYNWTPEEE